MNNESDKAVPQDYDGDGRADIAIYRRPNGVWYVIPSSGAPAYEVQWGLPDDVVPAAPRIR